MELVKFRLSFLVVFTTLAGYWFGSNLSWSGWTLFHTILGTLATAFAAAIFNQLLEIEPDARMKRTEDRPLVGNRLPRVGAFVLGWLLAAFGIVHLGQMVVPENPQAAFLAALTLAIYVFVYTPLKRKTPLNTVVGAVTGGIPPMIGWVAAGQGYTVEAWFLFALLFFWQMPHFLAINWMYRAEYERAGFRMWACGDEDGQRTSGLMLAFTLPLLLLNALPWVYGFMAWWGVGLGAALALVLLVLGWAFRQKPSLDSARKLFFATLLYMPATLILYGVAWRGPLS